MIEYYSEIQKREITASLRPLIMRILKPAVWLSYPQVFCRIRRACPDMSRESVTVALITMVESREILHEVTDLDGWHIPQFSLHYSYMLFDGVAE